MKTTSNRNRTTSEIDLFSDINVPKRDRRAVAEEVGELLKEEILLSVGNAKSPIAGENINFKALSPGYKKFKKESARPGIPNLEFTGNMLDQLEARTTTRGVELGIIGSRAEVAENHNQLDGDIDNFPKRRFLPDVGGSFRKKINDKLKSIVNDAVATRTSISRTTLVDVESNSDLTKVLRDAFPSMTRREAEGAVIRTPSLFNLFGEFNLLRFFRG